MMRTTWTRDMAGTLGAAMLVCALGAASAYGDFDLSWYTIDAGGSVSSTGGDYALSGTIGQPDAGTMTGGDFALAGGFWPGIEAFCYGDLTGDGQVGLGDLAQLLGNYGTTGGATYDDGDLDGDGDIDLQDLAGLLGVYGTACN